MLSETRTPTFTLELSAAGHNTQIAAAGGAVGLYEARELERAIVSGIGRRSRTATHGSRRLDSLVRQLQ